MAWLELEQAERARGSKGERLAIALGVLAVFFTALPTQAQQLQRLVRTGDSSFSCIPLQTCDVEGELCDPAAGIQDGDVCARKPSDGSLACMQTEGGVPKEIFCCSTSDDCGEIAGHVGTCRTFAGVGDAGSVGVCDYDLYEFCSIDGLSSAAVLRMCLADSPEGTFIADYWAGDCDGDTITNAAEQPSCVCDADPSCGFEDFLDGGLYYDAGTGSRGPSFTGDGGCTITVATASAAAPWLLGLVPATLLLYRRRRQG